MALEFSVKNHEIVCTNSETLASGSINCDEINVTFDSTWNNYTERYVVAYSDINNPYKDTLVNGRGKIPAQALQTHGKVWIGVRGCNSTQTITTTMIGFWVNRGAIDGTLPGEPSILNKREYEILNERLQELERRVAAGAGAGTGNSGTGVTVDTALSSTSTNPVQNKVVNAELTKKLNKTGYLANKYLGTDSAGNVITKDAPISSGSGGTGDGHTHSNKSILDSITAEHLKQISDNTKDVSQLKQDMGQKSDANHAHTDYVAKTGHTANKYLGTDADGNVVEKENEIVNKLDKNQGTANSGKILGIGEDGNVVPIEAPKNVDETVISNAVQDYMSKNPISGVPTYSDAYFQNFFAMQRTGKKYTVRFPLWEVSHVSTGEKLDDNEGMIVEASTLTVKGQDDYQNIPLFKTFDVNADIHYGKTRVLSAKGDEAFDDCETDTFVLGMAYYEKVWFDEEYLYLSRSDSALEGYTLCPEAVHPDGTKKAYCLYAKYQAGRNSQNILGSFKNTKAQRNMSYNNNINEAKKRGDGYLFGSSIDFKYLQNTFLIKYADKNFNNKLGGCFSFNGQYNVSIPEENTTRVILTASQANFFVVGACVSVGEMGTDTNKDRGNARVHNLADDVKILDIVDVDEANKALVLDVSVPFTTTATTLVSSMYWRSGFSDNVLGRDGCACDAKSQISSIKYPSVLQGIECFVGGYEVLGNAFMDLVGDRVRDVYVANSADDLTTNVTTAKETYTKCAEQMHFTTANAWNYITAMSFGRAIDYATQAGASGSGTGTGFCDGFYIDAGTSSQREFLCGGDLGSGSRSGPFFVASLGGLGAAWWTCLSRLSTNGFGGELTA